MTKAKLKKQVKELLKLNLPHSIEEIDCLVNSGAIDVSTEPDGTYTTARVVFAVILQDTVNSYVSKMSPKAKQDYKNLLKF